MFLADDPREILAVHALGDRLIKKFHILVIKGPTSIKPQFESLRSVAPDHCWSWIFHAFFCCIADASQFLNASPLEGNNKEICFHNKSNGVIRRLSAADA